MSKVAIQGDALGTGTFTIASPNSNSDRTLTLPDSAGTLATAESTLVQFNASGSAPVFAARAWVNFNGTGTVAIRASGNVSSITDAGTGRYDVNFTTAMPDADYGLSSATTVDQSYIAGFNSAAPPTTSSCRVDVTRPGVGYFDAVYIGLSFFR
jgi:hypothetical protein